MGDLITMLTKLSELNQENLIEDAVLEEISEQLDKRLQKSLGPVAYAILFNSLNASEETE